MEPSFQGYTCRWKDYQSPKDEPIALIVRFRRPDAGWSQEFLAKVDTLLGSPAEHHPLRAHLSKPALGKRLDTEVAVRTRGARGWARWKDRFVVRLQVFYALFAIASRIRFMLGKKDLSRMIDDNIASSDYRKYDNTLKMVVALDHAARRSLETLLQAAHAEGRLFYGLHVTDGGYAYAARQLKAQIKEVSS